MQKGCVRFAQGADGPLGGPGSKGSEGSEGSKGCGIALTGDEYKDRVTRFPDGHGHSEPPAKNLGTCRI